MSNKILFFSAPWCGPCKIVKKALTDDVRERLNIIEIDVSKSPKKSAKHQILGVPTFVKLEEEKEVFRKVGGMTIEELESL
jgi:thiol-disulfide isomerase/thioredoxin